MTSRAFGRFGAPGAFGAAMRGCALVCLALVCACASEHSVEDLEEERRSYDLWLAEVQRVHQLADEATNLSERERAVGASSNALGLGVSLVFEGSVWVKQDLAARLAGLELEQGRPARALEAVKRGLAYSSEPSLPVANLHAMGARAHEARGDRAAAVESYHRALLVNQRLMEQSLDAQ